MKPIILSVFLLFMFSCAEDNTTTPTDPTEPSLEVTGTLLAPNNLDPIVNAKVIATQNNVVKFETTTNPEGQFTLSLLEGDYSILMQKGLFSSEKQISITEETTLDNYKIETIPTIGVVTGAYDNVESVLYSIGLVNPVNNEPLFDIIEGEGTFRIANNSHKNHNHKTNASRSVNPLLTPNVDFSYSDLMSNPELLATYDVLLINCSEFELNPIYEQNLKDYVNNGGFLYVTDYAADLLNTITNNNTEYLSFAVPEKSGISLTTTATILDADLSNWLLLNYGITIDDTVFIDEFLNSWQVVDSYDADTTISWLNGPVEYYDSTGAVTATKDLAFTFQLGEGAVFYSSFHTENIDLDFTPTDRIMEYLVFEMTDIE